MPALPEHEVHIDTLPGGTAAAIAQPLAASMGRRKRRAAFAANLATVTLPNCRSPFAAHEENYSALVRFLFAHISSD